MEERANNFHTCSKCWETFVYFPNEVHWSYSGSENIKVVKCSFCEQVQAIRYERQNNINYDERYYC